MQAGKTLTVLGQQNDSRGLMVTEGIHLESGATLAGTRSIRSELVIDDGVTLSPGESAADRHLGRFEMASTNGGGRLRSELTLGENGR